MIREEQRKKAEAFRALHNNPGLFVLPNAWDVCSAKIFEKEGFKAMGTTSAGISATLGFPDGQKMSLEDSVNAVRRIAEKTDLPVNADMEAGYAHTRSGVIDSAAAMVHAGAVGLNLEDSTGDAEEPFLEMGMQQER